LDEQATGGQRSEKIGNADGEQTTGDNKQDFEANNARPHGGAMGERPRGMQRALAGFWVVWGMTATWFRRQQQHLTRFTCSRILKVKIWLKCAAIDARLAGRREQRAPDMAGKSARGQTAYRYSFRGRRCERLPGGVSEFGCGDTG
jgi:hypothetical protein